MNSDASDPPKTMKNLRKTKVFHGFHEIRVFTLFPSLDLFWDPFSSLFAPKGVIWPPLGPSWRHLGLPLGLLGVILAPLGLPLAVPWRPLEPILAIWDPQGTYWSDFSMNFMDF